MLFALACFLLVNFSTKPKSTLIQQAISSSSYFLAFNDAVVFLEFSSSCSLQPSPDTPLLTHNNNFSQHCESHQEAAPTTNTITLDRNVNAQSSASSSQPTSSSSPSKIQRMTLFAQLFNCCPFLSLIFISSFLFSVHHRQPLVHHPSASQLALEVVGSKLAVLRQTQYQLDGMSVALFVYGLIASVSCLSQILHFSVLHYGFEDSCEIAPVAASSFALAIAFALVVVDSAAVGALVDFDDYE
jgi:hypothetical protein